MPLRILHLDTALVAIDKPAGLLVHPSALDAHEERTALALLEEQLGEKLFPLHRLDKATSGVLLFARSRDAASRYALMEVEPLTGRRHQIRRHFKHIAHPLVGDTTHCKAAHNRAVAQWLGVSRLWLHAAAVVLPDGLRIDASCGPEWAALIRPEWAGPPRPPRAVPAPPRSSAPGSPAPPA